MSRAQRLAAAQARILDRFHARLATRSRAARALVSQPEPRSIGCVARGRQMLAGNLLFAGQLVEAPGAMLWDVAPPTDAFAEEIQGFAWLDDLAAVGDARARALAQDWLWGWIARHGGGSGPGWTPALTGRRLIRWIQHALFLLRGRSADDARALYRTLAAQAIFLARRGRHAPPGLPRFEALTGLLYAALSLEGLEAHAGPARAALAAECARQIDPEGGIPTRNPEELLEVFTLLAWAQAALEDGGQRADAAHRDAMARIAQTLRVLRHADGGLARFHGGGRGLDGRLEGALAASGIRGRPAEGLAMGFARLAAARSTVILDAAPPPRGAASARGHASTLAFELSSGRRPVIVNCGPGAEFGADWQRAGRATPSHSTLVLQGYSSARLSAPQQVGTVVREYLEDAPRAVPVELNRTAGGRRFEGGHDGYVGVLGLTHARSLTLTEDGRSLSGEDHLVALDKPARKRFDRAMDEAKLAGIAFTLHFHLHPDVYAELDLNGTAISLALRSGEIWVFRPAGGVEMGLDPSVYLEKGRLRPRATKQIVLSGRAMQYATRIRWSLAKAQETALAVRDLACDEADLTH